MRSRSIALAAVLISILTLPSAGAAPGQAKVLHAEGTVQAKGPEAQEWKVLKEGDWVAQGTSIRTGAGSSCDIALGEGSKSAVHMKADTLTLLNSLDPEKVRVGLEQGRIFSIVHGLKKDSTFQVSSPTAIASARGTGWEQALDSIQVFEHSVDVTGAGGETMLLEEGKGIDIGADGDLGEPFDIPADAKEEWKQVEASAGQDSAGKGTDPDTGDAFSDGFAGSGGPGAAGEGAGGEGTNDAVGEARDQTTEARDQETIEKDLHADDNSACPPQYRGIYC